LVRTIIFTETLHRARRLLLLQSPFTITIDREERKGSLYPFISTVTFAPEDNITRYDINSVPEGAKKSMNDLTKLNKLRVGELYLIGGKTNWK